MIVLIHRTYIFLRARTPKVAAGLAVAALIAGCGSGGGGATTPTSSATPTPTPTPSGVDLGVGSQAGNSGRAVGKISKGSVGSIVRQHPQQVTKGSAGSVTHESINSIFSKKAIRKAQQREFAAEKAAEKAAQRAAAERAAANQRAKKATHKKTPAVPPTISNPTVVTVTVREKSPTRPPKPTVRTVTKTKTKTVVKTVNHTVTKTVPPNVPAGAFLPSKHPVLAQTSFTVAGSNVVCELSPGGIRCGILRRVWAAPVQPASCKGSWGDTIALGPQGLPKFACGGNSPMSLNAKVIPVGWDDQLGRFTCQVRSFGVNCFSKTRSGFLLSRTGYAFY